MVANAYLDKYFYSGMEVIVRTELELFLDALFNHQIGAPLAPSQSAHQWLISYAASKLAASERDIPKDFFAGFGTPRALDISGRGDGISVLLVNAGDAV